MFFYEYNIPYTYTVEASNGSYYEQESKLTVDFNREAWKEVGMSFVPAVQEFIDLLHTVERRELVQTTAEVARKRFGSPNKRVSNDTLGILQQSLELIPRKETKSQYQCMVEEIKNDEKKHKKEESDSEVSSDDENIEDALPKAKLIKLGKSIV